MGQLIVPPDAVILLLISALCAVLALLLSRRFGSAPRLSSSLLSLGLAVAVSGAAILPFALKSTPGALGSAPIPMKLLFGLAVFLPSLWITSQMTARAIVARLDAFLHRANAELHRPIDYGKARARERGGDIEGALREYRLYFQENPTIPDPLFSAAQLLAQRRRFAEAEDVLREICARFENDIAIWPEATYRLANMLDADAGDKPAAALLFRDLIRLAGKTDQGRLAAERLFRVSSNPPANN